VPLLFLLAQTGGQAAAGDALPYARGFLVTGNYRVGGADLTPQQNPADINGFATGEIRFNTNPAINKTNPGIDNTVPADSEIVAAFLYWESIYVPATTTKPTEGVRFRGHLIDPGAQWGTGPLDPLNSQLVLDGPTADTNPVPGLEWATIATLPGVTATCWGAANQTGNARLTMFKFDVLHLLPKLLDGDNNWTGRRLVNDADLTSNYDENGVPYDFHTVTLAEGSGDQALQSAGAALVVVYRNPSEPLTKVVLYDGAYTAPTTTPMTQSLRGFFEHTLNAGRLTHIAGHGGNNSMERLYFKGTNNQSLVMTDPFPQTSPSSDRSWSFPTVSNLSMTNLSVAPGYGESVTTTVIHPSANPNDCLTWGAVVFSTPVLDADQDGLPDALEASSTSGGAPWRNPDGPDPSVDPSGQTLPNTLLPDLNAMGARTGRKDILVEVNALYTTAVTRYGDASAPYDSAANPVIPFVDIPAHNHLPSPEALKLAGDAFLAKGIHVHFDVGPTLAAGYASDIQTFATLQGTPLPSNPADNYIVAGGARGGETLFEPVCTPSVTEPCHFQYFPGTVGFKLGLELIRNAPVKDDGDELITPQDVNDWDDGLGESTKQRRRFDALRASLVHYGLYAHARGKPKSLPCLKNGIPTTYPDGSNACAPYAQNPAFASADYHVPTSSSGVGDLPGGNFLVTLGLWDALFGVGTPYSQGATTFHELGHNLNLWHGGLPALFGQKQVGQNAPGTSSYIEPNCKPNHQTTMSYLFQGHGLIGVDGAAFVDYSDKLLGNVDERALTDGPFSVVPKYRPTWFAPADSALATSLNVSAATRLCNGVKFNELNPPLPPPSPQAPGMARVWASPSQSNDWNVTIDWHGDGQPNSGVSNVNFDGLFGAGQIFSPEVFGGSDLLYQANDWANIRLDQIGAGSNVVVRRLEGGPELTSGDTLGGDTLGGDTLGGDTLGGDTLGGDTLGGDTLGGDTLGGDTLGGDTLGGDTLGGDTLGGDTLGGDTLGGDTLGGGELDSATVRGVARGETRKYTACILGGTPQQQGCSGPWYDNDGNRHTTQPSAGDAMYHKIYFTWFAPTSEPVDFYVVTETGGGGTTVRILQAEALPTQVGGRVSWVLTDQLPDHVNLTFSLLPKLDDGEDGHVSETTIAAVNDWPVAVDDGPFTTPRGTPITVAVVPNDTDTDSPNSLIFPAKHRDPLASQGTLVLNPNGTFTFTPRQSFRGGTVTFDYKVGNGDYRVGVPMNSTFNPPVDNIGTVTIVVQP
jgi:Bacterial Ig domain